MFIPVLGVLFVTPIAIVLGAVALYGGYKVVGVATLVVVIVNFLISPTFWLNLLAGASESGASGNRWLACFDIGGVGVMLYLSVRKPRRPERRTASGEQRSLGTLTALSSVAAAVVVVAAIAYRFIPSPESASGPSPPARPVSSPSSAPSIGKVAPSHSPPPEAARAMSPATAISSTSQVATQVYVLVGSNKGVAVYRVDKTGAAAVVTTIGGPLTGLESPAGMTLDEHGRLYVINSSSVVEYAPGAIGNVLPAAIIAGPATQLNGPAAIRVDTAGNIYVAVLSSDNCILEFAPTANGNATPIAAFGENGALDLALDNSGDVYASNPWKSSIVEYTVGADRMRAVAATISGPATGLDSPEGVAVDGSGNLYVTNRGGNSVTAYRPRSDGAAAPFLTIFGPATDLQQPHRIAVDSSGYIYVANSSGLKLLKFGPGSNGDVAPVAVISLPKVGLLKDAYEASIEAVVLGPSMRGEYAPTRYEAPAAGSGSGSTVTIQPALLPVPHTADREDDRSYFVPAPP
ncbi:MAG TPA: NHL repeat-containing protein, partial [Stellaceae bacterium]|nr:NHL repeat-containing protein [Stellaceae bacterium]